MREELLRYADAAVVLETLKPGHVAPLRPLLFVDCLILDAIGEDVVPVFDVDVVERL